MSKAIYEENFLGADASMRGPFIISSLFHVVLFVLTAVGLPIIASDPIISQPISITIVDPDEITQTNLVAPPVPKKEEPELPEPPAQSKPAPPQMTEQAPPDLMTPKAPEVKEEAVPNPTPPEPLKKEAAKPPPKPAPKKPEATKKPEKTQQKDFQSLLRNLAPAESTPADKTDAPDISEKTTPQPSQIAKLSDKLSISEEDALRRQLAQCWNVMAGAKYAEELVVELRVVINPDRTVQQATILDQGRYDRDSHYKAAADAAMRALRNPRCTPLELPPGKYEEWKTTVIRFDPREML